MDRRSFLQSVIVGTLAAPFVTRRQAVNYAKLRRLELERAYCLARLEALKNQRIIWYTYPRYLGTISSV